VRTTPPPVSQLVVVKINSDAAGSAFEPTVVEVKPGARVQWVNKDTVKRSVVSDKQGLFASGPLAPGASWTYTVKTPGTFNYHDGTRPYAVGQIVVRG
jgi:plastocyanin